ncbi:MAG: hypothetical protein AB2792_21310 [Candidatus Thiodiazotropha sp.]
MSMSWPRFAGNGDASPVALNTEVPSEHLNCHDTGESSTINVEKGCVFCGFVAQYSRARISAFVSLELVMPVPVTVAAPQPEHPVETPPPKILPV